jgi:uncharacterized BrkB/YihY/UPF0761 family membrane protein
VGRLTDLGRDASRRGRELAVEVTRRLDEMRPRVPALDAAMTIRDRDKRVAGSVLAGALAFRLFTPLLPLALLGVVVLGYSNTEDPGSTGEVANTLGIKESALNSIAHSARLSGGSRIGVVAFAMFALLTSSVSAVRAVRSVHALAWGLPLGRFRRAPAATLAFICWMTLLFGLWALGAWARKSLGFAGLIATIALISAFFAAWLAISIELPHPEGLPWRAFIPGAITVAVGLEVIHLVTVLYLSHKAGQVSAAYGALGTALILLLWLYLLSRLIVASAFLNATLWERYTREQQLKAT